MADNVFAKTNGIKRINVKAVICFILAFVMLLLPFADITDIEVVANAGSEPTIEIVKDGNKAYMYLKDCIGLTTVDFSVKLDPSVVSSVKNEAGKDFSKLQKYSSRLSNEAMLVANTRNLSDIIVSFVFADELYSSEEFNNKAEGCGINGEYFHFATLEMKLKDGYNADDIKLSAKGTATFGVNEQKGISFTVIANEADAEATAHTHKYSSEITEKADCENSGIKTYTCTCGDSYTEKIPSLGGHKLSWTVVKKSTSFREGKKEGICENCDYKEEVAIEKLPEIAVKAEKNNEIKLSSKDMILSINGTQVNDVLEAVPENTVIETADGNTVDNKALVATGMKLVMKNDEGEIVDTRVIVVPGDVDCDGTVSAADARSALRKSVELDDLDSYQAAAADIHRDSAVSADDARTILRNSIGLEKSEDIFKNVA